MNEIAILFHRHSPREASVFLLVEGNQILIERRRTRTRTGLNWWLQDEIVKIRSIIKEAIPHAPVVIREDKE